MLNIDGCLAFKGEGEHGGHIGIAGDGKIDRGEWRAIFLDQARNQVQLLQDLRLTACPPDVVSLMGALEAVHRSSHRTPLQPHAQPADKQSSRARQLTAEGQLEEVKRCGGKRNLTLLFFIHGAGKGAAAPPSN